MSNPVLFSSLDAPDLMMAGAAIFAVLCGIVLMGGRSAVGLLLRMLLNHRGRSLRRRSVACAVIPPAQRVSERDVRAVRGPAQRVA